MFCTPCAGIQPVRTVIAIALAIAALVVEPAPPAGAAPPESPLTLESALRLTRERNRSVSAARLDARANASRARDAGRRPNPELAIGLENFGGGLGGDIVESSLMISQTLEWGGDRAARFGVATAEHDASRGVASLVERAEEAEAAERFLEAWMLQQRVAYLRLAVAQAREVVVAAEARHRAGAAPEFEQVRAATYLATKELEQHRGEIGLAVAKRRLVLQWNGSSEEADSLTLPEPDAGPGPSLDSVRAGLASHPDRGRAEAEARGSEWRWRAARAARVPDPSVEAGVRRLEERGAVGFVIGLSMPLPLWNGGVGTVSAAELDRDAAKLRVEAVAADLDGQALAANDLLLAAANAYRSIRDGVLPRAEEALRLVRGGYRAGRLSYLDTLEAQRSVLDSSLLLVEAYADVWRARTVLELLAGGSPDATEGR